MYIFSVNISTFSEQIGHVSTFAKKKKKTVWQLIQHLKQNAHFKKHLFIILKLLSVDLKN